MTPDPHDTQLSTPPAFPSVGGVDSFYGRRRCVINAIAQHPFPLSREAKTKIARREPHSTAWLVSLCLHAIAALLLIGAMTQRQAIPQPKNAVTVIALQSLLPAAPAAVEAPHPALARPHPRPHQAEARAASATWQTPPAPTPQAPPAAPAQALAAAAAPTPDPAPAVATQAGPSTVLAAAGSHADAPPPLAYLVEVSRVIRLNLNYPAQAHQHGVAVVHIRIARDGTVLAAGLVQSSGNPMLDQEAREVVLRIHRFPEPPSAYVSDSGDFSVDQPIRFLG